MADGTLANVLGQIRRLLQRRTGEEQSDQALLEQFVRARDEAAFAALVERHGPLVLGLCRQVLHDAHAAEDAFQATFLVLARKAGSVRRREAGEPECRSEAIAVYDLTVDGPHNFFAGGFLVHNKDVHRKYDPMLDDLWYRLWPPPEKEKR
jgi:hypothetical protein